MKRRSKSLLWLLLVGVCLFFVVKFVAAPFVVVGDSMSPTLKSWDFCLMRRVRHYEPRRGDIIVFRTADDPPLYFVKRVIAVPGETISIDHGAFIINGKPLPEPYTKPNPDWQMQPTPVPREKCSSVVTTATSSAKTTFKGLSPRGSCKRT